MKHKYCVGHITQGGESFFAITCGESMVVDLRHCRNYREAIAAYKAFLAATDLGV